MPNNYLKRKITDKDKVCRICLRNEKFKISLFCTYAQQENIVSRIEKYLQIKIPTHEKSMKYICYECFANLKFVERCVNLAQENQKYFDNSEFSSENNMFEDETLQTPTEMTKLDVHMNFRGEKKGSVVTFMEQDTNSEELFNPKTIPKTYNKSFPFKNDFVSNCKRQKSSSTSDSVESDIVIKQENECDDNNNKNKTPHKLRLIKSFEHKFDLLKRSK